MKCRTSLSVAACLLLSTAVATPASDAKVTLGGVIDRAQPYTIAGTRYLLAIRRPYADGRQAVYVLQAFAGKYTVAWQSPRDYGNYDGDRLLGSDLTDLNRDGKPEVYVADVTAGNANGVETYTLTDLATRRNYLVEIGFSQDGSPGSILPGEMLNEAKAAPFRSYLETKVAQSARLKDTRNAYAVARDTWVERYGKFLNGDRLDPPLKISPITAKLSSELCRQEAGSILQKRSINAVEYRSVFRFGVLSLNQKTGLCSVILVTPDGWMGEINVVNGELLILLGYSDKVAIWNPAQQTLRWK